MSAKWRTVPLGEVLKLRRLPVVIEDDHDYQQVTVRIRGRGLTCRGVVSGGSIATKRQFSVSPGQLVVSKIDARNGAFGLVPAALEGALISGDFLAFDVADEICSSQYLDMYVRRPSFWDECMLVSEGSTNRVRLVPEEFLELEVDLPRPAEQDRIVEAVSRVEDTLSAHARRAAAARCLHSVARERLIEGADCERIPLAEVVLSVKGGRSPRCLDRPPAPGEWGVLKVSAIRDGQFRPGEAKALPAGMKPGSDSVQRNDLLYSRANTASLVGAMCQVERDYPRLILSDKTIKIVVDPERLDPGFLVEAIGASGPREHIEMMAGGTSESMKNISQDAFLATEVAKPPLEEQGNITRALQLLRSVVTAAESEVEHLHRLRQALTEELVTGTREVPLILPAA